MGLLGFQRARDLFKPHSVHHSDQFHQGPEAMVEEASTRETSSIEVSSSDLGKQTFAEIRSGNLCLWF